MQVAADITDVIAYMSVVLRKQILVYLCESAQRKTQVQACIKATKLCMRYSACIREAGCE